MPLVGVEPALVESTVKPTGDWILLRLDPRQEITEGGITVPAHALPESRTGVVIAVGPGCLSDDGKTRMPMTCRPGERVLFERAAGRGLPRVPRETQRDRWAYLLVRDGSVCAIVNPEPVPAGEQRALDAGAADLPPGRNVSRRGMLTWERLRPTQDWLIVMPDDRIETLDEAPGVLRPEKKLHLANGRTKTVHVAEGAPEETYDLWSGVVLRRGPGLLTVTRCLDGDRMSMAPQIVSVGQRCMFSGAAPLLAPIMDIDCLQVRPGKTTIRKGIPFLMREYPCIVSVL